MFAGHGMPCPYEEADGVSFCRKGILAAAQIDHAVAGEAEERGGGVAWLDREIEGDADGVDHLRRGGGVREPVGKAGGVDEKADGERQRVGAQPFRARFCSGKARFRGEAGALEDVQAVSGDEKRPEMGGFGDDAWTFPRIIKAGFPFTPSAKARMGSG